MSPDGDDGILIKFRSWANLMATSPRASYPHPCPPDPPYHESSPSVKAGTDFEGEIMQTRIPGRVLHLRKGQVVTREICCYPAYPENYSGNEGPRAGAERSAKEGFTELDGKHPRWRQRPWVDGHGVLLMDMFCVLPVNVYNRYSEPETNEHGEVSP